MAASPAGIALLVEPYDDAREMYVELFRHYNIDVIAVGDSQEALILAPQADVIVTDIRLGGDVDGYELISRLRRDEVTRDTPIIVLSASVMPADRQRAHDAGCDLFLAKPCPHEDLVGSVARVLMGRVRGTARPARLREAKHAKPRKRPA